MCGSLLKKIGTMTREVNRTKKCALMITWMINWLNDQLTEWSAVASSRSITSQLRRAPDVDSQFCFKKLYELFHTMPSDQSIIGKIRLVSYFMCVHQFPCISHSVFFYTVKNYQTAYIFVTHFIPVHNTVQFTIKLFSFHSHCRNRKSIFDF